LPPRIPAGLLAHELEHTAHSAGVEVGLRPVAVVRRIEDARLAEQVEAELQRIACGGVRELVDEALERECEPVAFRRAQRPRR
jgi:hypothetical protein